MTRLVPLALVAALAATPAAAGLKEAIEDHALPRVHSFAVQTRALAVNAAADCTAEAVRPSFQNAFDAWMGLSHLGFGPLEKDGRGLAIGFWPDKRGMVGSTVARLVAEEDAAVDAPESFAQVSVAGRGLFALDQLLYDAAYEGYARDSYTCRLVQALGADLARMAQEISDDWLAQAAAMLSAGEPGNATYLSEKEAKQQFFTALLAGLEFTADQRIGRPMGTFERPRPERAEARRSGRSLRNVVLSVEALEDLADKLSDAEIAVTRDAFATALAEARDLDDPVFAGVADPTGRLKAEIIQQRIRAARTAAAAEIGPELGVTSGFNSADGD